MVRLFVGVTDKAWFDQLSASVPHDEVNFWQPSGTTQFRALQPGELFLFKLHSPNNFIVGGGIFGHASIAPLSLAWEAFGLKNGVSSRSEMRARIASYRRDPIALDDRQDPVIGCRILTQPFFWPKELWLPVPESWSPNIVTGKGFNAEEGDGQYLWSAVTDRLNSVPEIRNTEPVMAERFGNPTLIKPRLGQGAFRLTITDNYERRCAVSGEKTLPILDAAHIHAFEAGGEHAASNGLLLRTDIHRLFDLGYVTVSPDGRFEVSGRLKADFDNGRHYYDLHGTPIRPPKNRHAAPSADALSWHREHRYLG
ncbi:HNH endonuclease [Rhizobium sophorae]|jgi:putative restriction endonuclease|uniref:HNH endonuclease n=1 Tax=Rhizobium sophorae TaxID=1535242 RepID=A0A7Y3S301_9HYPH|nr:HNH endonuclease [Rhizobium sophorae]NNU36052.1 HNH endonuclease [Rhizobium sophorae]